MSLKDESQKQSIQQVQDKPYWQPAMEILAKVTGLIAGPIVIALYVGRWLDERYNSEPWLYLASMGLAFAVSSIGIVKITLDYIKKIEKESKNANDSQIPHEDDANDSQIPHEDDANDSQIPH